MEKELINRLHKNFEDFAHNEDGVEFWFARDIQPLLAYTEWRNFEQVIQKAKVSCVNSEQAISDHFVDVNKVIGAGKGAQLQIADIKLTRYACYLIAQNGDPRKEEIAFAQTYFAIQTRKQELIEQRLNEIERLSAREKLSASEKEFAGIIFERGVDEQGFARIKSKGDAVLFGGKTTKEMKAKLKVPEKRALADFLPAVSITAKTFANQITAHKVKESNLRGESPITSEHEASNRRVRRALTSSGIYPEQLPPAEDIKKVENRLKSESRKLPKQIKQLKKKH